MTIESIDMKKTKSIAIVGSGPAALMAADVISGSGYRVSIFEKKKGPGRKLLIAGSSGLNITNSLPTAEFVRHYSGSLESWKRVLGDFSPQNWIDFIEALEIKTFEGTSGRYFVENMKASKLLRAWLNRLEKRNVEFFFNVEFEDFCRADGIEGVFLDFSSAKKQHFDAVVFCLGGGSYEPHEQPLRWPGIFKGKGLGFDEFLPSNVGYQVQWNEAFLKEAEGLPLKNVKLESPRGSRKGEIIITRYGVEGTPVYFSGEVGLVTIDLKPDLSLDQILTKCRSVKENLSPIRRVSKTLNLCPASLALLYHMSPKSALKEVELLAQMIKKFPITLEAPQSLNESISSRGGLHLSEFDESFMLRKYPGVFAAGEMLNWDAPTGGFLIQGCVSQGYCAGQGVLGFLR